VIARAVRLSRSETQAMHTHENGTHDGAAHKSIYAAAPRENRRMQK
jgi:hypothetical protein